MCDRRHGTSAFTQQSTRSQSRYGYNENQFGSRLTTALHASSQEIGSGWNFGSGLAMGGAGERLWSKDRGRGWVQPGHVDGGPGIREVSWPPSAAPLSPGTIAYLVFLCALWGGNMVAMKIGLQGVPPAAAAGFRL